MPSHHPNSALTAAPAFAPKGMSATGTPLNNAGPNTNTGTPTANNREMNNPPIRTFVGDDTAGGMCGGAVTTTLPVPRSERTTTTTAPPCNGLHSPWNPTNVVSVTLHCADLGITHFIDDRRDVLEAMQAFVPNLYLFGPQNSRHAADSRFVIVETWRDVERSIP